MREFELGSIAGAIGPVAVAIAGELVFRLPGEPSMRAVLDDWDGWLERIERDLEDGTLGAGVPLADVDLQAPLPEPRNLYMAGANYADHAREMRGLPPDAPIVPSPHGPFFFLKPTTTVIGPGEPVIMPDGVKRLDWEVELAAVIGRRAHRLSEAQALECVAGYMVLNDISARDRFKRDPAPEPPMTFDWFAQKGWATSCPIGPWIVPAKFCPSPGELRMTLTVNGETEQSSSTSEMIFDLPQLIAYVSAIVPLLPGDVISTGTPAGVGAGSGRFLSAGDEVVAEIEGLGVLRNPIAGS
jgi:2-keto-4-pentenoate hydratase/2-oxohepta-3-ene-1,7-dioic acid hydratase in catechol pathway